MNVRVRLLSLVGIVLTIFAVNPSHAALVISEFLAENDGGLHDSDGDSPDWIEIQNTGPGVAALLGWHLTDTPTNLVRWTFPATNLAPGSFLVVFASGKDRSVSGQELHTNFRLQNSGQYLALVAPDGVTVASSFSPSYPNQRRNVGYGIGSLARTTPLISRTAGLKYTVPKSSTGGTAWTGRTFADSTWTNASNGVGFDTSPGAGTVVLAVDFDERGAPPATQPGFSSFVINSNINGTTIQTNIIQTNATTRVFGGFSMTFSNTAPNGYDDRVRATPINTATFTQSALLRDHIMSRELTSTGGLDITVTGFLPDKIYRTTVWSYDTGSANNRVSDWFANGVMVKSNYTFNGSVLPTSDDQYQFSFDTTPTPSGTILIEGRRDLSSLANSPAVQINAIQFAQGTYGTNVATSLQSAMLGQSATVYLRYPFVVTNTAEVSYLVLRAAFDDGFVAYLNGQLVASSNAPASPAWNSAATGTHSGVFADQFMIFPPPGLLVAGTNILAVHALNLSSNDQDFFFRVELENVFIAEYTNRYFLPTTPGSLNSTGYFGFVGDTKFSVDRGFYDTPFSVAITSATPSAVIYWTTNGSAPSPTNGFVYNSSVPITGTAFLRAAAHATGLIPTEVETHSYIFLQQVLAQPNSLPGYPTNWQANYPADYGMDPNVVYHPTYGPTLSNDLRSLPTVSIVMSHADLWGDSTGIYKNSNTSGPDWEKPCSVELIAPDGSTEFAINCGIEIHGNASRDNARTPKHSFRLSFKSDYGPASLNYDWFNDPVNTFDRIVLRALGFGDAWPTRYSDSSVVPGTSLLGLRYRPENSTYLKDAWIKESMRDLGHLATRSDFAHLYLNGLYWGLINPSERIDAAFASSHLGGREMDWDVMAGDESYNVAELRDGSRADWDALIAQVNAGITSEASYQAVLDKVDEVNLIDYMMVHGIAEMEDWPFHNWYSAHRRATNGLPATKWIFLPWDQEIGMDRYMRRDRVLAGADSDNTPGRIYTKLRAWPEFRRLYGDRVQKHFFNGGALSQSNCISRFERLGARIFQALVPESARWGDAREFTIVTTSATNPGTGQTFTRNEWWVSEMQQLYSDYFGDLHERYISIFQANGLYPLTGAPKFSQFGGGVPAGFTLTMTHTNAGGVIYYTLDGSDPREYGTAAVGATAQAYSLPVPINGPTLVSARVLDSLGWSALVQTTFYPPQDLQKLVLSEIMYHPTSMGLTNSEEFEFVELKNAGTNELNVTGLAFTKGITFTFTNGTILAPGRLLVLVRNPAAFAARYPGVQIDGVYTGKLDDSGEELALSHPTGAGVFSVKWGDTTPWPVSADGYGFSLVPQYLGVTQASDNGAEWRASSNPGGSPGADDPEPGIPPIVINEVLAHTDPPAVDAIELYNPTSTNVSVGGWYLTDDPGFPWKYRISPGTTIPTQGIVYFTAEQFNAFPGTPTNFNLSSVGDDTYLFSAGPDGQLTGYSHGVAFGASFNGVSFGRLVNEVGDEFYPLQTRVTLGQPNSGPRIGPVVITEVHYNPETNGFEFLELYNTSTVPAPLFDPVHATNSWKINGIDYSFPTNLTLGSNEVIVLAGTNPSVFRAWYNVPAGVRVLGPFAGALQNDGENLQLLAPDNPNTNEVPYVAVEELRYNDRAPWPAGADGAGLSLQRRNPLAFANSPANWQALTPTPGTLPAPTDTDNDGLPDDWENANGTNPLVPDSDQDPDQDGMTNGQEYLAGTNPQSALSALRLEVKSMPAGGVTLEFMAVSNRTYSVLYSTSVDTSGWLKLSDVPAHPTNRLVSIAQSPNGTDRFYRLITPAQP